jgi:hypothetical protein
MNAMFKITLMAYSKPGKRSEYPSSKGTQRCASSRLKMKPVNAKAYGI